MACHTRSEHVDDYLGEGHGSFGGASLGWADDDAAFDFGSGSAHVQAPGGQVDIANA
jgi:hypothetical protein